MPIHPFLQTTRARLGTTEATTRAATATLLRLLQTHGGARDVDLLLGQLPGALGLLLEHTPDCDRRRKTRGVPDTTHGLLEQFQEAGWCPTR